MKAGILYPRSKAHPNIDIDFVDGIKSCLKNLGLDNTIQLVLESVGFGGSEKEVYEKAERLIRFEQVDIIIGFVDLKVTPLLEPLLFSSDKLMIVVNAGANYPQNWVPQPNIIYLTLQHAFLNWMTGRLASGEGEQAAIVSTFYDCGYLHGAAMVKHFMKMGGQPTHNYINNQRYDELFEISPLLNFLAQNNGTKKLLCTFDTLPASLFYEQLRRASEAEGLQLFVSPMMLEAAALTGLAEGFPFSIEGYIPWYPALSNDANETFKASFETQTKRPASIFALLGWEAALVIREIFQNKEAWTDPEAAVQELSEMAIESPRGFLQFDKETNHFTAAVIHCFVPKGATEVSMDVTGDTKEEWSNFSSLQPEGISSGWTNTYLCY